MHQRQKVFDSIIKGILNNTFIGSFIVNAFKKRYPNLKDDENDNPEIINEQTPSKNINTVESIVILAFGLINLKQNIEISEINTLMSVFKNDFNFDKEDIIVVNNILNKMIYETKTVDPNDAINAINQYCKYEEKLLICKLLFKVAASDNNIDDYEHNYISNCSQNLLILSSDFSMIRNEFVKIDNDLYHILGINSNSSNNEIKSAYRFLMIRLHPDKNQIQNEHEKDEFQKVIQAYSKLKKIKKIK